MGEYYNEENLVPDGHPKFGIRFIKDTSCTRFGIAIEGEKYFSNRKRYSLIIGLFNYILIFGWYANNYKKGNNLI